MNVITVSQIKTNLGITDASFDEEIAAVLPMLDAKVKAMTGSQWSRRFSISTTVAETLATIVPLEKYRPSRNIGRRWSKPTYGEFIQVGTTVSATVLPADSYITEVITDEYDENLVPSEDLVRVEFSEAATATDDVVATLGMNIAYHDVISKLAWWMLEGQSTDSPDVGAFVKRMGPVSVNYGSANSKIDGRYGVPRWAVVGLPRFGRSH